MNLYATILVLFLSCNLYASKVINGYIDLSDKNFEDKTYKLDGDWLFSWNTDYNEFKPTRTSTVPGFWNKPHNGDFPMFGQACYRVNIKIPKTGVKLALRINNIHNSYKLYIEDSLVHQHGKTSKTKDYQIADWSPFLLPIYSNKTEFKITFVVSNFGHRNAGFASSIQIGDYEKMIKDREFYMSIDAITAGGLLILGMFLLGMFILWKREKSLLYFLGFSLSFGFWTTFRDEKVFFSIWKTFDWELALRLEYGAMILGMSFFVIYISSLFPKQNIKHMQIAVLTINSISLLVILLLPPNIFTFIAISNVITLAMSVVYIIIVFYKSIISSDYDNKFTTISIIILFIYVFLKVFEFFGVINNINTTTFLDIVTLMFIVSMALIFADRFSGIFKSTVKLKEKAEKQQKELEEKNRDIISSIKYAKHLQSTILPTKTEINKVFKKSFVFFKPKDIVSGDFYWLQKQNNLIFFATADCTGHGVPGAMVSFVCYNALIQAIKEDKLIKPNEILNRTREIVIRHFSTSDVSLSDGMDISLCVYNIDNNILQFSGANNSLWIIKKQDESIVEYKGNKQPVGNYITELKPFDYNELKIDKGDRLYMFTDGYIDQFGGKYGKKFKTNNLKKLILQIQQNTLEEQQFSIIKSFYDWKGEFEQIDDVCVFGIEI